MSYIFIWWPVNYFESLNQGLKLITSEVSYVSNLWVKFPHGVMDGEMVHIRNSWIICII